MTTATAGGGRRVPRPRGHVRPATARARLFTAIAATLAAFALFLGTAVSASATASGSAFKRFHDPHRVTYSIRITSCRFRDRSKLPDVKCTPGSLMTGVTQKNIKSTICKKGWTATIRPPESETSHAKYRVAYPAYHVRHSAVSELDHLIPLELGGSNDITNLWPELGKQPNAKDAVENAVNHAVCRGRVSLAAAQRAIATDWITAEAKLGLKKPSPKPRSAWCTASAAWNSSYSDYDVYVHSNQPHTEAVATASNGASQGYETDGSGYADIYLYADRGDSIGVTVGPASCSTTAG